MAKTARNAPCPCGSGRKEDGADVFFWRVGTGPDNYAGFFELYQDGLTAWASSQSLLDEAIARWGRRRCGARSGRGVRRSRWRGRR